MAIQAEDIDLNDDRLLVERYQAGDRTAFDVLYQRYFPRLRGYCQRKLGDHAEAEEVAQEAFVRALTALPRLSGERRFYPWVTVIASRLCVDHYRRRGRVRPSDDVDLGSVDDDSHRRLAVQDDLDNLDRALCRLGNRHREVLELREHRGLTYAEIADRLEVPRTTVEALLFRARKALRREFQVVSGERLAAVPVVGWLLHRGSDLRLRFGAHLPSISELTGPVAVGGMAAALSIVPMGPGGADPGSAVPAPASSAPAVAHETDPAPTPLVPTAPAPAASTAETTGDAGGSGDATGTAGGDEVDAAPAAGAAGVTVYQDGTAKEKADDMPISESLDDASIGVDPGAAGAAGLTIGSE